MSDPERVKICDLPTLADRPRGSFQKGPSRVEEKTVKGKSDGKAWEECRRIVWARDGGKCRCCGRVVVKSLELRADRGECHHIVRRAKAKALLTDPRNVVLVCLLPCHEGLTHHEIAVFGPASAMFDLDGARYLDASSLKLKFIKKGVA